MKLRNIAYALLIIATICLFTSCNKECKHKETAWIIDAEATCVKDGVKHEECTKCHEKLMIKKLNRWGIYAIIWEYVLGVEMKYQHRV